VYINRTWKNIGENISAKGSLHHYKLELRYPRFDEECSTLLRGRKQAKFRWLQSARKMSGGNMDEVRYDISRNLRKRKGKICETKLMNFQQTV
jgi:hypothetical protein